MDSPYISQVIVHDCYAIKELEGLNIPKEPLKEFKHIILTGKNGSGKTTILNRINLILDQRVKLGAMANRLSNGIEIKFSNSTHDKDFKDLCIFSFFRAHRRANVEDVTTVTTDELFLQKLNQSDTGSFAQLLKQYLVNKKIYEALDYTNGKEDKVHQNRVFFNNLEKTFQSIFEDKELKLEFIQESFEFYITHSDKRKVTFNNLSDGFSAFLNIVMDLLIRTDLIRKQKKDFDYQPHGIVLIDEPEIHLHLSMQYNILPLISRLFPKIQFVVATHSPAIISSLENSIVFDLTSKSEVSDWVLGSSFSELMVRHFGLENEYSPIADKILEEVNIAAKKKDVKELKSILDKNEKFLTPVLQLEIESLLITIKNSSND